MSLVGRLEDLGLSDIFQLLSVGKKTGILIIRNMNDTAFFVFKNGLIVRADTNVLAETIGHELVKKNIVKQQILDMALKVKNTLPSKPIAEILLDLSSASRETIEKVAKKRIEKVVYHFLLVNQGDFKFLPDTLDVSMVQDVNDTGWEVSKGISPEYLLVEGARVYDEAMHHESFEEEETEEAGGEKWEADWGDQTPVERKDISALKALTHELRFPNTTSEITLLILRFASDIFQRGILFMVGRDEFVGLGQFGLEIERPDEKVRETILAFTESKFLKNIIENLRPFKGPFERDPVTERLTREFGLGWPTEIGFFPVITEGRVVALLYCDSVGAEEGFPQTEGLDIFISQAGLALEKSLLQRKIQEMEDRENA